MLRGRARALAQGCSHRGVDCLVHGSSIRDGPIVQGRRRRGGGRFDWTGGRRTGGVERGADRVTSEASTVTTLASNFSFGSCRLTCQGGGFTRYGHWAVAAAKARRAGKVCAARRGRPCPRRAHHFGEGLHHLVQSDDGAALEASVAASARWALLAGRGVLPAAASAPSSVPAERLLPAVAMEACHSPALETKRIVKAGEDPEVRSV